MRNQKMDKEFSRISSISLVIGSTLMAATLVLHPSGGSMEHILNIKTILITSHSLAILSLPFIAFGFWGLSNALLTKSKISMLSFIISCFGLFAAMVAATINGLTLPLFLSKAALRNIDFNIVNTIRAYGDNINMPTAYLMFAAFALSIGIWSILIIRSEKFPKWIGYYGLLLILLGIFALFNKYNLIGLLGFRTIVLGIIGWTIAVGTKILFTNRKHA
ncbi:hypothetical protein [Olivibacter sitiensis]|uniref:hypothetical protein n=1 Tax=Olivibacter sitiensis TaxID=376470 RepID=UPI0004843AEE|nr:hypothetical protein [Olivibacter sitiensis]